MSESLKQVSHGAEPAKGADAPEIDVLLDGIRRLLAPLRSPISKNERSFVASHICDEIDGLIETFRRASPIKAEGEAPQGWICPACGRSNAPTTRECACRGNKTLRERIHTP